MVKVNLDENNLLEELIRFLEHPKALLEDIHLKADEEHPEYIEERAIEALMELEGLIDYLKTLQKQRYLRLFEELQAYLNALEEEKDGRR